MTTSRALASSASTIGQLRAMREEGDRDFLAKAFDYLRENAVFGDVHEYGCDRRPILPLALGVARDIPVPGMKFFGFASFAEPRVVPGRGPKSEIPLDSFVKQADLEASTRGEATLFAGSAASILSLQERDRFMNTQNKIALAVIHAPEPGTAKPTLEFVEPLLTEGSLIYFCDLTAGYRRTPAKEVGRAFLEFQRTSRFQYVRFLDVGWWGRCYMTCLPTDLPLEKL